MNLGMEPVLFENRRDAFKKLFAINSEVEQYDQQRPWTREYLILSWGDNRKAERSRWPRAEDAPALRELLADPDPILRGLAVEALATLHDPEDVPRIAQLLKDEAESSPALGMAFQCSSRPFLHQEGIQKVALFRMWQPRRVSGYARGALWLMTGQRFNEFSQFEEWWEIQHGGRERVWFWQERLHRDLAWADIFVREQLNKRKDDKPRDWLVDYNQQLALKILEVRSVVAKELEQLPVEIETKVRLFAINRYSSALGSSIDEPLMGPFECKRISSQRLMELLEHKNFWDDVKWDILARNTLAKQIVGQADKFFQNKDVKKLREIHAGGGMRESDLWWSGQASYIIGIAKLLPPASPKAMDDLETRDGALRAAIRNESQEVVRGTAARELMEVGLTRNWDFLVEQFWKNEGKNGETDLRTYILDGLYSPPLTAEKRTCLAGLLLDQRFERLWCEGKEEMGSDQHRQHAFWAVNAFAGKEVLHVSGDHDFQLADPKSAPQMLKTIKEIIRRVLLVESAQ